MADKSDKLLQLLQHVRPSWTPPAPLAEASLLEQGMLCVLSRKLTATQATASVKALRNAYPDWNVLRVSQVQEAREHIKSKSDETALAAARELKDFLQEIYQKNHGFDIEWLREDDANAGKFVLGLEVLGGAAGHILLHIANPEELPITQGIVRVLDRIGLMGRTSSIKRARARLQPLIPPKSVRDFAVRFGEVVHRWCDPRKPTCWECPLVEVCAFGKRTYRDWKNQQKRLAAQRMREAARLELLRRKDEARRMREEERDRKRREVEERQRAREAARRARAEERKKKAEEQERKRKERESKKSAEKARREATARKKVAASKARKKTAKKRPPKRKPATKKPATKKKPAARKSGTRRKPAAKKPATGKRGGSKSRSKATKKKAAKRRR